MGDGYATAPGYADMVKRVMDEIDRIIKTKGIKQNPWKMILPVILVVGTGLMLYGVVMQPKAKAKK